MWFLETELTAQSITFHSVNVSVFTLVNSYHIIYNFQTSDGTLVTWEVLILEHGDVMQSATKTVSQGVKGRGYDSIGVLLLFACEVRRNGRSSITLRCKVSLSLLEVGYSINEFLLILLASFATLRSGLFCTIHCIEMTWWADVLMGWWVLPKFAPVPKKPKNKLWPQLVKSANETMYLEPSFM